MPTSLPILKSTIQNNLSNIQFNLNAARRTSANFNNLSLGEAGAAYNRLADSYNQAYELVKFVLDGIIWLIQNTNLFSNMDLNELFLKIQTDVRAQVSGLRVDIAQGQNAQFLNIAGYLNDLGLDIATANNAIKSQLAREFTETKAAVIQSLAGVSAIVSRDIEAQRAGISSILDVSTALVRNDVAALADASKSNVERLVTLVKSASDAVKVEAVAAVESARASIVATVKNAQQAAQDALDTAVKPIEARLMNLGDDVAYRVWVYFRDFFFEQAS